MRMSRMDNVGPKVCGLEVDLLELMVKCKRIGCCYVLDFVENVSSLPMLGSRSYQYPIIHFFKRVLLKNIHT